MDIISSNPRSFKLDRKSSQASKLKQAVVEKLFEFLGNDSGNVLAEYIVVLVCNGKNQNQARDDLEAFLGYQSRKFVSWLWGHLSKSVIHSGSSNLKDASLKNFYGDRQDKDKRTIGSMIHLNHSTGVSESHMSKDDKRCNQAVLSTKKISSDTLGLEEEFQRWCPNSSVPVADANAKEGRPKHRSLVPQNNTYNGDSGAMGHNSTRLQCSSRISGSTEQSLLYGDRNKMVVSDNCLLSDSPRYSLKRKLVRRSLQPEKPLSRLPLVTGGTRLRLSSRAPHDVPDQFVRPRGSVWDRLGKPMENDTVITDDKTHLEERNTMKKKKPHHGGPSNHGFKKIIVPDDCLQSRFLTESPLLNNSSGRATNDLGIYYITKKRNFRGSRIHNRLEVASDSNVVNNAKDEEIVLGIQRSPSYNQCLTQNLKGDVLEHRSMVAHLSVPTNESLDYPHSEFNCRGHQVHAHKKVKLSIPEAPFPSNNSSLAQMEGFSNAAYIHTYLKRVDADLLNVKLRLYQIEIETRKLRAKQMETKEDVELGVPLYSGIENRSDEDLESRTVLVTNVDCDATKKTLISHFSKCGAVVNATLLTDRGSGQPKGSAYVVFSCKELADKAVAMSGTSFFSRTLKIVHKANMQTASLPLLQPAVESVSSDRPLLPPAQRKAIIPWPHSDPHLRWQREPSTNTEPQKPVQNEMGIESTVEAPRNPFVCSKYT